MRPEQWVADEALDQPFWLALSQSLGLAEPKRSPVSAGAAD